MVDIHSATAEIRRGKKERRRRKKEKETTGQKYNGLPYRGHEKLTVMTYVQSVHHWHEHKHASVAYWPLVNCVINERLLVASPHMQQTLSQLINVVNVTVTSYLRHM